MWSSINTPLRMSTLPLLLRPSFLIPINSISKENLSLTNLLFFSKLISVPIVTTDILSNLSLKELSVSYTSGNNSISSNILSLSKHFSISQYEQLGNKSLKSYLLSFFQSLFSPNFSFNILTITSDEFTIVLSKSIYRFNFLPSFQ